MSRKKTRVTNARGDVRLATTWIHPKFDDHLREMAKKNHTSISDAMRTCIQFHMDHSEKGDL